MCALQRGKWPFIDGAMTDGISRRWAYADTDATSGACIRFDHRARSAIIVDHAHCAIDGAVIHTEGACVSLPGQAGITIDRSMRHLDGKFMAKDPGIAGIDARQIAAHDTWSTQGINHRGALPCWAGCFRGRTNGPVEGRHRCSRRIVCMRKEIAPRPRRREVVAGAAVMWGWLEVGCCWWHR